MERLTSIMVKSLRAHILLLFLAIVFTSFPASAWDVMAVRDKADNLAFCRAEMRDDDSPLSLAVALSPTMEVNIGIKVPGAGFEKGEAYDVRLAVDNDWNRKVQAETATDELLIVRLGKQPEFLAAFERGNAVTFSGSEDSTVFPLKGSKAVLHQLKKCVGMASDEALNDLAPGQLPPGIAALLQQAGLSAQAVALPETKGRMVDYAWVTQIDGVKIDGGFIERKTDAKFVELMNRKIAVYEQQCTSKAKTQRGKTEGIRGIDMQTALIECGQEAGAFLFYKTDTGIFATIIHRASGSAKAEAMQARDKVTDVVRRLAAN